MSNPILEKIDEFKHENNRNILSGVVGVGEFGASIVRQAELVCGLDVSIVSDIDIEKAIHVFFSLGYDSNNIVYADSTGQINDSILAGKKVVCENPYLLSGSIVDAVVDATGDIDFGAEFAHLSIKNKKNIIMANLEADITCGAFLAKLAKQEGVVYTLADGDQPSLVKGLFDWAQALGFDVISAGKATKLYESYENIEGAGKVHLSYLDGSKNQMEMASVANMTGFVPDIRGMHKPSITLSEIADTFIPSKDGGIFNGAKRIDVLNCFYKGTKLLNEILLDGGVFIVLSCSDRKIMELLKSKNALCDKSGQYACIFRQHHFIGSETLMSILKAVLYNEATGSQSPSPTADVVAIAKDNIKKGEKLTGMGGNVRCEIVTSQEMNKNNYLPYGLANSVYVNKNISKGGCITYDMLKAPGKSAAWQIRKAAGEVPL